MAMNVLVFVFMIVFGQVKRHQQILIVVFYLTEITAAPVLFS